MALLARLGAVTGDERAPAVTDLGRRLQRLPVHPRLARILVEGGGSVDVAAACALLADGRAMAAGAATTTCDLLADIDRFAQQPPHVRQLATGAGATGRR